MGTRPKLKWVPLTLLFVDDRYQRELTDRLGKMIQKFDERRLTPLSVSKRSDDRYAVILGQHRYEMLVALGWKAAPCFVHEGLTPQEESELFDSEKSDRKELTQLDVWKSELFRAEEPTATIDRIVREEGFYVADGRSDNKIRSVGALRRIYRRDGETGLRNTLRLVRRWDGFTRGRDGHLIEGIALFLASVDKATFDTTRMEQVVSREDPQVISTRAASRQRTMGGTSQRPICVREELLMLYNKGLRNRRLFLATYDEPEDDVADVA